MKRVLLIIGILTQLVMSQAVHAYTFADNNNFFPKWASPSDPDDNSRDVIGHPDISEGTVSYYNDRSISQIAFKNVGATWADLFAGDLFINLLTSGNDNKWDYVVHADSSGVNTLWKIGAGLSEVKGVNDSAYIITTPAPPTGLRNDHPTGVTADFIGSRFFGNPFGLESAGTVNFDGLAQGFNTAYDFTDGQILVGEMGFILGWTLNCANDVIYEQIPVPEPGTMVLLGLGMFGLAIFGKRRMQM